MFGDRALFFVPRLIIILLAVMLLIVSNNYTRRETTVNNVYINNKLVNVTNVETFIPPFINIVSDIFVAPDYGIAACGIRKSMSQLTINIMCLLYDTDTFLEKKQSLNDTWLTQKACEMKDRKFQTTPDKLENDGNMTKIAFIRDPFDRFISFYLDKCVRENGCFKCRDDMHCIVRSLYEALKRFTLNRNDKPTYIEMHAAPLSWNCDFNTDLSDYYLLKMGAEKEARRTSVSQLANILSSKNVSSNLIHTIVEGSLNGETVHGTHRSTRRSMAESLVRTDPVIREYLHKIYFYDYIVFNFDRQVLDNEYQADVWKK